MWNRFLLAVVLWLHSPALFAQGPILLRGVVRDPSGSVIPAAIVEIRGAGGEQRSATNARGEYAIASLVSGRYQIRVVA